MPKRITIKQKKREVELRRRLRDIKLMNIQREIELERDRVRMGGFFMDWEELHFLRHKYGRFAKDE